MAPQKIALLTDSCADLSPRLAAENHIYIVPLRILCADGEYADAVSGTRFSVKKSKVEGKLAPLTTYILYSI